MNSTAPREAPSSYPAERPKAFLDAVVAIAMTLLILPLMESVGDVADVNGTALQWLGDHRDQLISFALSFVIIAMFWVGHHRLFADVDRVGGRMLWLLMAWAFSIVWLPVATAISGQLSASDLVAKAIYIGSMLITALLSWWVRITLKGRPDLHRITPQRMREGLADDLALVILFAIALILALVIPGSGYLPLLVMALSRPMQLLIMRVRGPKV